MNGQVNISPETHAYASNLLHNLDVWRKIISDPWVLETVSGYHSQFKTLSVQSVLPRPPPFSKREKQLIVFFRNLCLCRFCLRQNGKSETYVRCQSKSVDVSEKIFSYYVSLVKSF